MNNIEIHPASYKDPSGFIFKKDGLFYRQVNLSYRQDYDHLISSGLYKILIEKNYLIPHQEIKENLTASNGFYKTLLPAQVSFVSYPYEWCFGQLKDAALLTLSIQKIALKKDMILKDATPFNVQYIEGKPVFIDTLSFEKYNSSQPWVGYRQFCQSFLYPLLLQKYLGAEAQKILLAYPAGMNATTLRKLLPWKSKFNFGVSLHVMMQSGIKNTANLAEKSRVEFDEKKMHHLIDNLQQVVESCELPQKSISGWSNYYDETILGQEYLIEKEKVLERFLSRISFSTVLDMGANEGYFSKIVSQKAKEVIAVDADPFCINKLYNNLKDTRKKNILPLCVDVCNPTPAIGFGNSERTSFLHRTNYDMVMALALIHHLAISENLPLPLLAKFFRQLTNTLLIEFVPREDEKIRILLAHRKDIFVDYTPEKFETAFNEYFVEIVKEKIPGTERTLYLFTAK